MTSRSGGEIGDVIRLTGQIYPGEWEFVLRGIYKGDKPGVDENSFFFHYDYLDEVLKQTMPGMAGGVGWYLEKIDDVNRVAEISAEIDALFDNSSAETLTETEKSFTLNFLAMMDAIITGMRITTTLLGLPDVTSASFIPLDIIRTAANTKATSMIPRTVKDIVRRRAKMLLIEYFNGVFIS